MRAGLCKYDVHKCWTNVRSLLLTLAPKRRQIKYDLTSTFSTFLIIQGGYFSLSRSQSMPVHKVSKNGHALGTRLVSQKAILYSFQNNKDFAKNTVVTLIIS